MPRAHQPRCAYAVGDRELRLLRLGLPPESLPEDLHDRGAALLLWRSSDGNSSFGCCSALFPPASSESLNPLGKDWGLQKERARGEENDTRPLQAEQTATSNGNGNGNDNDNEQSEAALFEAHSGHLHDGLRQPVVEVPGWASLVDASSRSPPYPPPAIRYSLSPGPVACFSAQGLPCQGVWVW